MRKLLIATAVLMLIPAASQAKTLDEVLAENGVVAGNELRASGEGARVYWNKGTRLEFPDTGFDTSISTEFRTRYDYTNPDGGENSSEFSVPNARVVVSGHALNREFSYLLRAGLTADDEDGTESADLLDGWISWDACESGSVKMGRFKTALSRQYNTDVTKLQFADRSVASDNFDAGRSEGLQFDLNVIDGVAITGQFLDGVEGADETDHAYVVGVRLPIAGELDAYSEGDVGNTEDLAADLGVVYGLAQIGDDDVHAVTADINVKSGGVSVHGEFFLRSLDPESGSNIEDTGFYVQAGVFLTPKELELAARYSMVDCDDASTFGVCEGNDSVSEASASLNYYWWAHHLKAQVGVSQLTEDTVAGSDVDSTNWSLVVSSWF